MKNRYFQKLLCFEIEFLQFTMISIMQNDLPSNPFLRNNPFYIPQKFYSHSNLQQNSSLTDSTNKYTNLQKILISKKQYLSYGEIIKHSILLKKEQLHNTKKVTKLILNKRQSLFQRKNLLQNNYLQTRNYRNQVEKMGILRDEGGICNTKQKLVIQIAKTSQQTLKSPKFKHLQFSQEISQPSQQKYLASELKIKLRSQTYLEQGPEEPLTRQKTNKSKDQKYYPSKFKWKGKEFFVRQIT